MVLINISSIFWLSLLLLLLMLLVLLLCVVDAFRWFATVGFCLAHQSFLVQYSRICLYCRIQQTEKLKSCECTANNLKRLNFSFFFSYLTEISF